jgi:haloacetate dehalogenase
VAWSVSLFAGFVSSDAVVNGVRIHYKIGGTGEPLLLLHGYPETSAMWANVAPRLAQQFTVVCSDLRGYGDSEKPPSAPDHSTYSFREMARDQVELMGSLGYSTFHVVGHDRGARTAHRMALDHAASVRSVSLLDIAPTLTMLTDVSKESASRYWHWYFLSQPPLLPETLIQSNADYFFESCVETWGRGRLSDVDARVVDEYRRCWNDADMIRASCEDYRAAMTIDFEHDTADSATKIACPVLVMWGSDGAMAKTYDMTAIWLQRCVHVDTEVVGGGHFFVDLQPLETCRKLTKHLWHYEQRWRSTS